MDSACPAGSDVRDISECEMAAPYVTDGATAANPPVQNLTIQTYTLGGPWVSDEWGLGCITSTGMQTSDGKFASMWWNTHMPSQTNLSAACRQVCYEYCSPSAPTTPATPPTASPPPPPVPSATFDNRGVILLGISAFILLSGITCVGMAPFFSPVRVSTPVDPVVYGLKRGIPFASKAELHTMYGVRKKDRILRRERDDVGQRLLGVQADHRPET